MTDLHIRTATAADLPAINDIYNHYVLCSTATYQEELEPMDARETWFDRLITAGYPVTVAEMDGEGIVGWGALVPFRPRSAYRFSVENSVYVRADQHRRGIGRALMVDLLTRARPLGYRTIVAGIDAEQAPSVALHAALGFEQVAYLKQVGFKFGRWLDVVYMQLML